MRRKAKLPELLAPAGDFECLYAAVGAGADAIYVGGKLYSARAYAKNFDIDELRRAVAYCHLHGVKLYVTLNTLLYNNEIPAALDFARELYRIGVDALIVADVGLIRELRLVLPELELHGSTQMSVHNSYGADLAAELGCTRVVLARELSSDNISEVTERCTPEIEVFLHGALCVSHSGQCLFSSMVGGRSGNRGECAQPCRLPYGKGYPLSLRDLSLAHHIPSLIKSGVASLKIEGRMKSPEYVYTVVSIYRKLLDECRPSTPAEDRALDEIFSRGGFTDGYYRSSLDRGMTGVRSEEAKALSRAIKKSFEAERVSVFARAKLALGEPSELTLGIKGTDKTVTVYGTVPSEARSAPLDADAVKTRLAKMGNSYLSLETADIELLLDEGINLSPGEINALRRACVDALEAGEREVPKIEAENPDNLTRDSSKLRTALFYEPKLLCEIGDASEYFDVCFVPLHRLCECESVPLGVLLPPVIMESELDEVTSMLRQAKDKGVMYALVGNIGHLKLVSLVGLIPIPDFRLNVYNSYAAWEYAERGFGEIMLSPELTLSEVYSVGGRGIVYGRLPLMLTERCFMKDSFGCRECSRCSLTDRRGVSFPMMREYKHRNIIFNSAVTYLGDKSREREKLSGEHFIFSVEDKYEALSVIDAFKYSKPFPLGYPMRRIGKRKAEK